MALNDLDRQSRHLLMGACSNVECADLGKYANGNVIRFGMTKKKVPRFRCKTCGKTFTETKGSPIYRKRTLEKEMVAAAYHVKHRKRSIHATAKIMGHKRETIINWLRNTTELEQDLKRFVRENDGIIRLLELGHFVVLTLQSESVLPPWVYDDYCAAVEEHPLAMVKWVYITFFQVLSLEEFYVVQIPLFPPQKGEWGSEMKFNRYKRTKWDD